MTSQEVVHSIQLAGEDVEPWRDNRILSDAGDRLRTLLTHLVASDTGAVAASFLIVNVMDNRNWLAVGAFTALMQNFSDRFYSQVRSEANPLNNLPLAQGGDIGFAVAEAGEDLVVVFTQLWRHAQLGGRFRELPRGAVHL